MSDPIANLLSVIQNAAAARQSEIQVPFSGIKFEILKSMQDENIICEVSPSQDGKFLSAKLGRASRRFKRISKPGRRVYTKAAAIPRSRREIIIISTPQGVMTAKKAIKKNVGGEVLLEID